MSYSFRIRLNRAPSHTMETTLSQIDIAIEEPRVTLSLRASSPGKSIRDAEQWSLIGEGYRSENEAAVAGAAFHDALLIAFAKMRVGVDFGSRTPKGGITAYGQEVLSNQTGQRALNNVHGLMVYTSDPRPVFFEQKASFVIGRAIQSFDKLYFSTLKPVLSDRDRLALTLYHASYFQPTADTRFLVLVMAIEALIEPGPKSAAAIEYVDRFIDDINGSSLAPAEKNSLVGSLRLLRHESINRAGQRLASERLGDKPYQDKPASRFFCYVYGLRSDLVHGNLPSPTFDEIAGVVAVLDEFVSDLLTTGSTA